MSSTLTQDLHFDSKTMEDLIKNNNYSSEWPGDLAEYHLSDKEDRTLPHETYKQEVLAKMLAMGCNTEKVWLDFEQHMKMSMEDNNQYPTTLHLATAHILGYKKAKQKQAQKQGKLQNVNESDTSEQDERQDNLEIGGSPDNVNNKVNN